MNVLRLLPLLFLAACATSSSSSSSSPSEEPGPELQAAIEEENWEAALPLAQRRVSEQPRNARAWQTLGSIQAELDQDGDAVVSLEKSLALRDDARTRAQLGVALATEERIGEAWFQFKRSVEMEPGDGRVWLLLGQAQALMGQLKEANESLERARTLLPDDEQVLKTAVVFAQMKSFSRLPRRALEHHKRGGELANQGQDEEARREYEAALVLAPDFADCHYNLGLLARRGGDLVRAEKEYRAAIAAYPPEEALLRADASNNLADTLVARGGDAAEAVRLAREAISLRGERLSYVDTLARACDAQGDPRCAADAFRKLLESADALPPDVRAHAEKRLGALSP